MRTSIILTIFSMTLPVQGAMAMVYSILDFAGQARQAKGPFQKYKGTNKCKWSVSISLVIFYGMFAIKLEVGGFYESLHSCGDKGQALTFTNVNLLLFYLNG